MAVGDIWQIVLKGSLFSQAVNNVFYYQETGVRDNPESVAADFAAAFENTFFSDTADGQLRSQQFTSLMQYLGLGVVNLFSQTDFADVSFSPVYTGTGAGEAMPPFVAYEFFTQRTRRDVRAGRKRFAGVIEGAQQNGVIIPTTLAALNNELAALLSSQVPLGSPNTGVLMTPVTVKRIKETVDGKTTYRLPTNLSEAVTVPADVWVCNAALSTQSTRKYGRGS